MSELQNHVVTGLLGAASHAMGRSAKTSTVSIQAQPPKPPVWKRVHIYPYLFVAAVLIGIITTDVVLRLDQKKYENELASLEEDYNQKLQLKQAIDKSLQEAARLKNNIQGKQKILKDNEARLEILERLQYRQSLLLEMLNTIQNAITDDVIINVVNQKIDRQDNFYIRGWGTTHTSAQLLVNRLEKDLKKLDLRLIERMITADKKNYGTRGYKVEIWLRLEGGKG